MKKLLITTALLISFYSISFAHQILGKKQNEMHTEVSKLLKSQEKPRVIVMTDGEVDDRSAMIRFLLYTNDIELLAIIQTNSVYQKKGWSSEKWIEKQIAAYEKVYPNLIIHDPAYPSAGELRNKILIGDEDLSHLIGINNKSEKRIPGMPSIIDPADWDNTPGSEKIVEILLDDNPRQVHIQAWGGGNTAAKAFHKLKTEYPKEYERAISKVVMYNIWYQDGAGSYIETHHPKVTMILSHYFKGTWDYGSQRYTKQFVEEYLHNEHGPLAALYPQDYISEGDSPAFLYSISNGLRSHENPTYGGWGGRFYKVDGFENVYRDVDKGSYLQWIEAANRDFESRLRWCIADSYDKANHKPIININGGLNRNVRSGELIELEVEIVDNDSLRIADLWSENSALYEQQGLNYDRFSKYISYFPKCNILWWQYMEAGTFNGKIEFSDSYANKTSFRVPPVDKPETIHIILEVTDIGIPALTSFVRIILNVIPVK